jgi:hypothetical protein
VPELDRSALTRLLRQSLVTAANRTGGWGYSAAKSSRVEPTAWALLALAETAAPDPGEWQAFATRHLQFLKSCQRADGLLLEYPEAPPNLAANGIAACVLAHLAPAGGEAPLLARLLGGLASVKGVAADTVPDSPQNNALQGWPWIPGTFSWVEPTSWCVLALKKTRQLYHDAAAPRIIEGDKLLLNRSCEAGGWNYGNGSALGQDLRPYVPTTALALIALQDHQSDPVVERSLAYLDRARVTEPSAMALAMTVLCLRIYGRPADDVEERLAGDLDRAQRLGNLQALAMMLYAGSAPRHQAKAFRI